MAGSILTFGWVKDGVTARESSTINELSGLTDADPEFAKQVVDLWWVPHDMTKAKSQAISRLLGMAYQDLALARHVITEPFMGPPFRQRDEHALWVLWSWAIDRNTTPLAQLASEPWFTDGLDDLEAVLLPAIGASSDDFRQALIDTHYVASVPIELPLAGEVGLVVVRHTPFPKDDHTFATLEESVRAMEEFMAAPWPAGDVILLLVEPDIWGTIGSGKFVGYLSGTSIEAAYLRALILAINYEAGPSRAALYHETAHHYDFRGHRWLVEGAANFFEAYMLARTGGESLEDRLAFLETHSRCERETIQQHIDDFGGKLCSYELGEKFMLAMYADLGKEVLSASLRDLYAKSFLEYLDEDTIFHAFQSNVPPEREEAFKNVYRKYHGGPLADVDPEGNPDRPALVALFDETGGSSWANGRNWTSVAPLGSWHGVATELQGRVRRLDLDGNGLAGNILPELGSLSDLRVLSLSSNSLVGEIPPELGSLNKLVSLSLGGNHLTGEIPPVFGDLTNLKYLHLVGNQLTGAIPSELAGMRSIVIMDLRMNQLTGRIPAELAGLTNLENLFVARNLLSGEIPPELGKLSRLTWLDLANNRLSGQIPLELGNLSSLEILHLRDNLLSGQIPLELGNLSSLEKLRLRDNLLSGQIPSELGNLKNLKTLELSNNQLSGQIPPEIANLEMLRTLQLNGNQLSGEIPPELGRLSNFYDLNLSGNSLSGPIPPELGNLGGIKILDFRWNQLSGEIPAELGKLTELEKLYLGGNHFTGCIPEVLRKVPSNDLGELGLPYCAVPEDRDHESQEGEAASDAFAFFSPEGEEGPSAEDRTNHGEHGVGDHRGSLTTVGKRFLRAGKFVA